MIDMLDMTDQEINLALAELVYNARECHRDTDSRVVIIGDFGTYNTHPLTGDWKKSKWRDTPEEAWQDIPNYCNDAAASLEVQAKAIKVDAKMYVWNLSIVKWKDAVEPEDIDGWESINLEDIGDLLTASPRERAEAAYMTLSSQDLHPLREDI